MLFKSQTKIISIFNAKNSVILTRGDMPHVQATTESLDFIQLLYVLRTSLVLILPLNADQELGPHSFYPRLT